MEAQVIVVTECLFSPFFNTKVIGDQCKISESQERLTTVVEEAFTKSQHENKSLKTLFLYIAESTDEVNLETGMTTNFSKIAEKFGTEAKFDGNGETFVNAILIAKTTIDTNAASKVNFIVPSEILEYAKTAVNLIFNSSAYSLHFDVISIPGGSQSNTFQIDRLEEDIRRNLTTLNSADGLPITVLVSPMIPNNNFYHGYTTRTGGVSTFPTMKSMSLIFSQKKKDTKFFVEENRRRLAQSVGFAYEKFNIAKAVHGIDVWVIGDEQPSTYDAIVTDKPGITVAAPGADCQTLLFCDPVKMVVGAAHSGWKGTIDRVQQNVIHVMKQRFSCEPKDIRVAIGPSIGVCCYNVTNERAREFINGVMEDSVVFRNGIPFLDLWKSTVVLLEEVGISRENIDNGERFANDELIGGQKVTQCTQCNEDKFFSYRRDGAIFGNQIGFIGIRE